MGISFELNELPDPEVKGEIECLIRDCIGASAEEQDWKVWIYSAPNYCQLLIKGLAQTRSRFFFEDSKALIAKVRDWLLIYPFR